MSLSLALRTRKPLLVLIALATEVGDAQAAPLTPGQIEEVTVDCWSTSQIINTGHRLRVTITSSNSPHFDVNPGTGQPWSDNGEKVKQTNRIYCDAEHPSRLVVPVVE